MCSFLLWISASALTLLFISGSFVPVAPQHGCGLLRPLEGSVELQRQLSEPPLLVVVLRLQLVIGCCGWRNVLLFVREEETLVVMLTPSCLFVITVT